MDKGASTMRLTTEQLKAVIVETEMQDGGPLVTSSYSGRSMYGHSCLGYTVEGDQMLASVAQIMVTAESMSIDLDSLAEIFGGGGVRWDSMGRSAMIVYFPRMDVDGIDFAKDDDDDDDDE